jgi:dolichol-phosphate mannosyltransferase
MNKSLVIIPTYNEIENIAAIIDAVLKEGNDISILVIDDGSPDGTATVVREKINEYPNRVYLEERSGKLGLGTAYIHGFKWALERGYEYILEMDADFSHNPDDVPKLIDACKGGADMAIGSRYISGVNVVNWPMSRVLMSYYASAYVRIVTGMNLRDTTAGFVCYRRRVLENIGLDSIEFKGYAFQIEMKYKTFKKKFKIVEVPIIFVNRVRGTSKMSGSIFGEAAFGVIKLRLRSLFGKL